MNWTQRTRLLSLIFIVTEVNSGTITAWAKASHASKASSPCEPCAQKLLREAQRKYGVPPVSAREDRVWHAIPGLNGWTLEEKQSQELTEKLKDGKTHLVWSATKPQVSLKSLLPSPVYRGPSDEKSIALMVNVSWGEQYLPSMLETFKKEHVRATFFLDGAWVKKNPQLARKIVGFGHAIGSHGTGHPDFHLLTTGQVERQMTKTESLIKDATGKVPVAFAPPSGSYDDRTVTVAYQHHLPTILWTVDTVDWRKPSAETIVSRVVKGITPGALVLMHPTEHTAEALPTLIEALQKKGYRFKTITDVIGERRVLPPTVL